MPEDHAPLRHVYAFGQGAPPGALCEDASLVGGKAASLATMTSLGLRVPPGVVLAIRAVRELAANDLDRYMDDAVSWIERATGKKLGDPLTLAVRGGAAQSMPGVLPTVLDLGDRDGLRRAIETVAHAHPDTAVIVQAMVRGEGGGSGVVLTRDPQTGEKRLRGEWIAGAPGRDVVGGKTVPSSLVGSPESLDALFPEAFAELVRACAAIEGRMRDVAEIELTVERGTLWLLQARRAEVSPRAQVRIAVDLVSEGVIDAPTAVARIPARVTDALVRRVALAPAALAEVGVLPIGTGLPASAGTASGVVLVSPEDAVAAAERGEAVILVRRDASTEDVAGMRAAAGILTSSGGLTSHAAVVARALGKPCVTGATDVFVDYANRRITGRTRTRSEGAPEVREPVTVEEGETITVDGSRGRVYLGTVPTEAQFDLPELETLLAWANDRAGTR